MVGRTVSRVLLALLCVIALCSCGLLTSSYFPEELMQVSTRKDLSDEIPKAAAKSFALSVVTANGIEYVVLASDRPYDGIHVFLIDEDLDVVSAFTLEELNAPSISTQDFQGNRAFADSNPLLSRIVVGNRWFQPFAGRFILETQPTDTRSAGHHWQFGFATPNHNVAKAVTLGFQFSYILWENDWIDPPLTYSSTINGAGDSYELIGVFSDPALDQVVLTFRNYSVSYDDYVVIPRSAFTPGGYLAQVPPDSLFTYYSANHFTRPRLEQNVIGYAQNGMVGFSPSGGDEKSGDMVRFDLGGNPLPGSLHVEKLGEVQNAYPVAGGHYYSYNRETRVVTKLNAWWK